MDDRVGYMAIGMGAVVTAGVFLAHYVDEIKRVLCQRANRRNRPQKEELMHQYNYEGPVMLFNTCVEHRWKATTFAVSESKAKSNLAYQYKKKTNRAANTKIMLPGKIVRAQ